MVGNKKHSVQNEEYCIKSIHTKVMHEQFKSKKKIVFREVVSM